MSKLELHSSTSVQDIESRRVIDNTRIVGGFNGKPIFTPGDLINAGLWPTARVEIEDKMIWFSRGFIKGHGFDRRLCALGFIGSDSTDTVVRSFYMSNSHGLWKYVPWYKTNEEGELIEYGKGYGEESVTVPLSLQKGLAQATTGRRVIQNPPKESEILHGTAPGYFDLVDTYQLLSYNEPSTLPEERMPLGCDYATLVNPEAIKLDGNFYTQSRRDKPRPETLQFVNPDSNPQYPNYSKSLYKWQQRTSLYGRVGVEVIPSGNEEFFYMFLTDHRGRVWVGQADYPSSPMLDIGLRQDWVDLDHLSTPPFEYRAKKNQPGVDRTGGYAHKRVRLGEYVGMYPAYGSKIPVVQEYLTTQSLRAK